MGLILLINKLSTKKNQRKNIFKLKNLVLNLYEQYYYYADKKLLPIFI